MADIEQADRDASELTACVFGQWIPKDPHGVDRWLARQIKNYYKTNDINEIAGIESRKIDIEPLHSSVQNLKDLIQSDPEIYKFFHLMFTQVPKKYRQIPNYHVMLRLLSYIISIAPPWYTSDLVGAPIMGMLLRPMITVAGTNAFVNAKVNAAFKKILGAWCVYLKSLDSRNVLTKTQWLSPEAMAFMPDFANLYKCNPELPHWGFDSWDHFFTREFKPGRRPVARGDNIIANACESAPLFVMRDVKLRDTFWVKDQPYCLGFMLADDPNTSQFVGGTVYQAFLSQLNYHRWHSPVDGTIDRCYVVDGSYYAEALTAGYHSMGIVYSQCYISTMATRALIFIRADNPDIGLMCVVPVGMAEVSSCDITTYEGARVKKGDELGMFHYGGSTHCLVFRKGVDITFVREPSKPDYMSTIMDVKAKIGTVNSPSGKAKKR